MKTLNIFPCIFLALIFLLPSSVDAQTTFTIKGFVKEGANGLGYENASIKIQDIPMAVAGPDGSFTINFNIPPGVITISVDLNEGSASKTFTTVLGVNWMNLWVNPPDLPSDFDNNYYEVVEIGAQTWMTENLTTTHYSDGIVIPLVESDAAWDALNYTSDKAYCFYANSIDNFEDYGALYTWHAAMNGSSSTDANPSQVQGVCPSGWHLPSDNEWKQLEISLGMSETDANSDMWRGTDEGDKLKATSGWITGNGSNSSGFTALPGGVRYSYGPFASLLQLGEFWSATEDATSNAWVRGLERSQSTVFRGQMVKKGGHSVRCIKDVNLPTVITTDASDIEDNSCVAGGTVTSEGSSSVNTSGICWSISSNPELSDDFTEDGSGVGSFISNLTGLDPYTTYYVRAYATNASGTAYGNEISFSTHSVNTQDSLALASFYATAGGTEWTDNSNWTTGPVNSWFGIWLSSGEVVQIRMPLNNLDGTIPPEFWNLENLQSLDFSNNNLSGALPSEIGNFANLRYLRLGFNQFSGSIPSEIQNLTNLVELFFQHNQFTGTIPNEIGNLSNLQILNLAENSLSGIIPESLGNLSNVWSLQLQDNELSGIIPSIIGELGNLRNLYLRGNLLTGTIPNEIYNLTTLESIVLADNQITGPLADQISNLVNLDVLEVSSNQLTGPVPESVTSLNGLQTLGIRNNMFTSLPDLSPMTNLSRVYIENNQFDFDDIEPLVGNGYLAFTYSPQASIDVESDATSYLNEEVIFTVNAGGTASQYTWWMEDNLISGPVADNTLTINPVTRGDAGQYSCEVTNTLVPGLTLFTNGATLDVLDAIQVINTNDAGNGSLRAALAYANTHEGYDNIVFNIPGDGPHTIQTDSALTISGDEPVFIDGYSQAGARPNNNAPGEGFDIVMKIELDGFLNETDEQGMFIFSDNNIVSGLVFNRFAHRGISIWSCNDNVIEGNYFGTDTSGRVTSGYGIGTYAIELDDADFNTIRGNLVSGNGGVDENPAIFLGKGDDMPSGSDNNLIVGNLIGTDETGLLPLPNTGCGLSLVLSSRNTIGGLDPAERNILYDGVWINGPDALNNKIIGNYIGTDVTGNSALGEGYGVGINSGAQFSEIGPGNVISGNGNGIRILEPATYNNRVFGNYIGVSADGSKVLPNRSSNIIIENATFNRIGGLNEDSTNVISGAASDFGVQILGPDARRNYVLGNKIGTNPAGDLAFPNKSHGIVISDGSSENVIGPDNLISGNTDMGVLIMGSETSANRIIGNLIGTNATGNALLSNADDGVNIFGAPDNIIEGNTICGAGVGHPNPNNGIEILKIEATGNVISNNFIGTNLASQIGLGNGYIGVQIKEDANDNVIGPGNVISGNLQQGIVIESEIGTSADYNTVYGNYIGTTVDGMARLDNEGSGILIRGTALNNTIGPGNVISGNKRNGIHVSNGSDRNSIIGNFIGLTQDGLDTLSNKNNGIILNSAFNTVGGTDEADRNVISGNIVGIGIQSPDANDNRVIGNYLGTNKNGTAAVPNTNHGVFLGDGTRNEIGPANLISGNDIFGVLLIDNAHENQVFGNYIGTDHEGGDTIANFIGVHVIRGQNNTIGSDVEGMGNLISGNEAHGILIYGEPFPNPEDPVIQASGNRIIGNLIGTNAEGSGALYTEGNGITLSDYSGNTTIGGLTKAERNIISGNQDGIRIQGLNNENNVVQGNFIGTDITGTSAVGNGWGMYVYTSNNMIGGIKDNAGNVISGNINQGLNIISPFNNETKAENNEVFGNFIGLDVSGRNPLSNDVGLMVVNAASNTIGGPGKYLRNIISGNLRMGLYVGYSGAQENRVEGNFIGTDLSGKLAVGNGWEGILLNGAGNYIGGTEYGSGNLVSGNQRGIMLKDTADNNLIMGNIIGLDIEANKNLGNSGGPGVALYEGASGNKVGGKEPGEGNFISGSSGAPGVAIYDEGTDGNLVQGNIIGTNKDREEGCSNLVGVSIYNGASNNLIGGMEYGEGNVIAYNEEEGVIVYNETGNTDETVGNSIWRNAIFNNGEMGIDLGDNGVTPNDPGDVDASPNHLQNYPVLDSIGFGQGEITVFGQLNSTPNSDFILQFYANYVGDHSTYGEGQTYLGSDTVMTETDGEVSFGSTFQISGFVGQVITATATDPDGNTSEFSMAIGGVKDQVLAAINRPFEYWVNEEVVPTITGDEDLEAIKEAFQTWADIPTADIEFEYRNTTPLKNASATDGYNLVSFRDEKFPFAPGVLAVSAKTLRMKPGGMVAEILDADVIFNPLFVTNQETPFGIQAEGEEASAYDIQSVATHEIGHVLGMIHTGVVHSTMFYMLEYGSTEERSLEMDDIAWASYRYPATDMDADFGYISGSVVYGDRDDRPAVAGALVLAVDTESLDQVHAYTDADGSFKVPIPLDGDPSNEFWIHIQPLDGDVFGYNLRPGNISPYIFSNTLYTDFPDEFYDEDEGNEDNPKAGKALTVETGQIYDGVDLITNSDLTPPTVEKVSPALAETGIGVNPEIKITFSEAVEIDAFSKENCYLECETDIPGETYVVGGSYIYLADSRHKVLMKPLEALKYEKTYTIHIEGIPDLKTNLMDGVFESTFVTDAPDTEAPIIWDVLPKDGSEEVYVRSEMTLFFSEPMDKESFDNGFVLSSASNPNVEGRAIWDNDNATVSFKPDQTLEEGSLYTMTVSTQVTDNSGIHLENEVIFTFTTTVFAPPEIIYLGPADLEEDITVETPVVVDFSEPVNTATISTSSFKLLDEENEQVPGDFHFLNEDSRIVFEPEQALNFDHSYQVILSTDIYDRSEPPKSLENPSETVFTTAKDLNLPHIMYIDPPTGIAGAVVTIGGSGFSPFTELNKVNFDGVEATVTNSTLSSIAVLVPVGAFTGPVTVEVEGDAADNSMRFYVLQDTQDPEDYDMASAATGTRPRSVSISPDAGYAYVTNQGDGTVSAINLNSELYDVTTIHVGQEPVDIDIDPNGTRAYVANYLDNTVSVLDIDPESHDFNTWMHDINVGIHPNGLAVSSKQKVYVGNERSLDVSVIDVDPASGGFDRVVRSISTGTSNRSVSITPDAALVLVTGENGVSIIDINPAHDLFNTVIRNSSSGTSTRSVTIQPDAGIALVLTDDGDILILDIYPGSGTFGEVRGSVSTGTSARNVTISPDAQYVFVTNQELNTVTVYKLYFSSLPGTSPIVQPDFNSSSYPQIGLEYVTEIPVQSPYAIAVGPFAEKILVTNYTDAGGVTIIKFKKGAINPITSIGELIISLNNALKKGIVPAKKGESIMKLLVTASEAIQNGKISKAIDQLYSFINKVDGYTDDGWIPFDLGTAWIEAAYSIIAQLEADLAIQSKVLKAADESVVNRSAESDPDLASIQSVDGIQEVSPELILYQNYPNPFGQTTRINFEIPSTGNRSIPVLMRLYNTSGQVVKTLIHMNMEPGRYSVSWNGTLDDGGMVTDGIYMLELRTKDQRKVMNLSVIR